MSTNGAQKPPEGTPVAHLVLSCHKIYKYVKESNEYDKNGAQKPPGGNAGCSLHAFKNMMSFYAKVSRQGIL